jgi:hypothetical protein
MGVGLFRDRRTGCARLGRECGIVALKRRAPSAIRVSYSVHRLAPAVGALARHGRILIIAELGWGFRSAPG